MMKECVLREVKVMKYSWQCPFCGRPTTITDWDLSEVQHDLLIRNKHGRKIAKSSFIVCPNPDCEEFIFSVSLQDASEYPIDGKLQPLAYGDEKKTWRLIPPSNAKVFPDYVPEPIRNDYTEACKIVNDSPKASATLSRRCLQGMIRGFWGISKPTLKQEIDAIKDKVDPLTWQAIDAVRTIGNIGAHMEKDINFIIDVEPGEAELLIGLIEWLIKDWYINGHEREKEMQRIVALGQVKNAAKKVDSVKA